jgi:hypothetical protein
MQKAAQNEVVNQRPDGLQLVKAARSHIRYTGTAYDGQAASRMERAGVVRMPRCCHSVIREPGNGMFEAYLYAGVRVNGSIVI